MYVGVVHVIQDQSAWDQVIGAWGQTPLPEGFELLATGTSAGVDRVICLWRAPSADALQGTLDEMLGSAARNDCFALAEDRVLVAPSAQPAPA